MENCQHKNGTKPDWTYSTCKDCGAVLTDGDWGIASRKWFRNLVEAKFYKEHGRFSDGEELAQHNAQLKVQNKELLARCDLLEAELCRFQCEIETIVMTLEEI